MSEEVSIQAASEHVSLVQFSRPPNNFFDAGLIRQIADAYQELEGGGSCRAIVLCSQGKHFCAGANFHGPNPADDDLYEQAVRLFSASLPVVAAVQGAAVGGGLGVALSADFRGVYPVHGLHRSFIPAVHFFQGRANLADRSFGAGGGHGELEQIACFIARSLG